MAVGQSDDPADEYSENFTLAVGDAVMLLMQGSTPKVYSLVGDVPAQGSVYFNLVGATPTCKCNYISLPWIRMPSSGRLSLPRRLRMSRWSSSGIRSADTLSMTRSTSSQKTLQ